MRKTKAKHTCKRQQSTTPTSQSVQATRTCAVATCRAKTSRGQLCAAHYAVDLTPPWRIVGNNGKITDQVWEECVPTDVSDLRIGKSRKLDTFIRAQCKWLQEHPLRNGVVAAGQLSIKSSLNTSAGLGLFTTGPMYAGEVIAEYTGDKRTIPNYHKKYPGDTTRDYALTCKTTVVDASETTATIARYVNTSRQVKASDGNSYRTKARNNCTFYELDGRLFLLTDPRNLYVAATRRRTRLTRAIPPETELYVSYGTRYWGKLDVPDVKTLDLKYWVKVTRQPKQDCITPKCRRKAHTNGRCKTCNNKARLQVRSESDSDSDSEDEVPPPPLGSPTPAQIKTNEKLRAFMNKATGHTPKPAPKRKSARRQSARRQSSRRRRP